MIPLAITGRLSTIGVFVALVVGSLWLAYCHGISVERKEWQARWNARDADDLQAVAVAESKSRTEEQRRQTAINQVSNDARTQQVAAVDDADHADRAGERLHVAAQDFAGRASCAASDSRTAERSASTRRAALVLSDLLSRADKRAGELATAYDRARIAGMACERAYESLSR
ncbi:hypothetical protein PSCICO_03960 [Pseudomonas cichorii]|uniref:DUF2514 domain-containing protein n=1 Tax=Pseudomonas cichorii TaxID=36746 RepID=UPI0019106F76|nr:DUF2514 domain-containing protein [Pseudomonas cichorii]GFM84997.1 hypothetical protein PSCICO_03960 [Pseudomonas cichorii]